MHVCVQIYFNQSVIVRIILVKFTCIEVILIWSVWRIFPGMSRYLPARIDTDVVVVKAVETSSQNFVVHSVLHVEIVLGVVGLERHSRVIITLGTVHVNWPVVLGLVDLVVVVRVEQLVWRGLVSLRHIVIVVRHVRGGVVEGVRVAVRAVVGHISVAGWVWS